ncbi:hypothetical protein YOLOSWAG_177 [Erwinia phage vB_EamM_Yoloswag]|uniref:Uncharacterized protein n=1 Tax=Erwinia phage vB_EamM_Yoloswag TaxID=1958956 RepID=A0A1S6L3B2_9CAUD|nr:head-tail connector protein [Erwinia phage vB_EamM_Yoloswag]AQT28656.1 hypothetical protein YOLOSWAG_177 [Erwinia phage vB_EamM_Yoloswag]
MRTVEGQIISVEETFLDEFDEPLYPREDTMGPIVKLIDPSDRGIIAEVVATTGETPGQWVADIAIPELGLYDEKQFDLIWTYESEEGTVRSKERIYVDPAMDVRVSDIVTLMGEDSTFDVTLPFHFDTQRDTLTFQLSINNQMIVNGVTAKDSGVMMLANRRDTCSFRIPLWAASRRLEPMALVVRHDDGRRKSQRFFTYTIWAITPQVTVAVSMIEGYINKARQQNVIPELEYTQSDLVMYLYRGLALFNQLGSRATGFTGTNMQGTLLNAWVVCACYYALAAQLQAEGSLAFDFTGQVVNLNMDRTPAIEAALGRIETEMQGPVTNLKNKLSKAGINEGDGSVGGGAIDGARAMGRLGVINAPTTKWATFGNRSIWVNTRYRVTT